MHEDEASHAFLGLRGLLELGASGKPRIKAGNSGKQGDETPAARVAHWAQDFLVAPDLGSWLEYVSTISNLLPQNDNWLE